VKLKPLGLELVDARRGSRAEIIERTSKPSKVNDLAQIQCHNERESAQETLVDLSGTKNSSILQTAR
jgi:hypothetical protein